MSEFTKMTLDATNEPLGASVSYQDITATLLVIILEKTS